MERVERSEAVEVISGDLKDKRREQKDLVRLSRKARQILEAKAADRLYLMAK